LGIGDWGLGIGPNPQSPIPNPQILNKFYKFEIIPKIKFPIRKNKYLMLIYYFNYLQE